MALQVGEEEGQVGVKKGQEDDEGLSLSCATQAKVNYNLALQVNVEGGQVAGLAWQLI